MEREWERRGEQGYYSAYTVANHLKGITIM